MARLDQRRFTRKMIAELAMSFLRLRCLERYRSQRRRAMRAIYCAMAIANDALLEDNRRHAIDVLLEVLHPDDALAFTFGPFDTEMLRAWQVMMDHRTRHNHISINMRKFETMVA